VLAVEQVTDVAGEAAHLLLVAVDGDGDTLVERDERRRTGDECEHDADLKRDRRQRPQHGAARPRGVSTGAHKPSTVPVLPG
jgi:hypothetical protein